MLVKKLLYIAFKKIVVYILVLKKKVYILFFLYKNGPERIKLLTLALLSWSIRKITKEIDCTRYVLQKLLRICMQMKVIRNNWPFPPAIAEKSYPYLILYEKFKALTHQIKRVEGEN